MLQQVPRNALNLSQTASPSEPPSTDPALGQAHTMLSNAAQAHTALQSANPAEGADAEPANPNAIAFAKARLITAIGAAAALANTPQKWAQTIALLRRAGIDPEGYEDFGQGRLAAAAQAGLTPLMAKPIAEIPTG